MSGGGENKAGYSRRKAKKRKLQREWVREGKEKGWNGLEVLYLLTCAYIHTYLHTTHNTTMSPTDLYTFTLYIYICHRLPPLFSDFIHPVVCIVLPSNQPCLPSIDDMDDDITSTLLWITMDRFKPATLSSPTEKFPSSCLP